MAILKVDNNSYTLGVNSMNHDDIAAAVLLISSLLLLLLFVRNTQLREASMALLLAQFFSWPLTLAFVYFHLQVNPVRFFHYATQGTFLFAFIFHPAVFVVYYLRYPQTSKWLKRIVFSMILPGLAIGTQWLAEQYTNLVYYPYKWIILGNYILLLILSLISRKYLDWFFKKIRMYSER
jgi:hypothetical protein